MTSFSYPRQARIRRRKEFLACYEHGAKFHSAHFILYALARPEERTRTGVAVSKKTGKAVVRNRIKRVLREFFRLNFSESAGLWLVAVAKKNAFPISLKELEAELAPVLRRLRAGEVTGGLE